MSERRRLLAPRAASARISAPRPDLQGSAAIATMCDDMRVAITRTGSVTEDDLGQIGWMQTQIVAYGKRAREMATRLSLGHAA